MLLFVQPELSVWCKPKQSEQGCLKGLLQKLSSHPNQNADVDLLLLLLCREKCLLSLSLSLQQAGCSSDAAHLGGTGRLLCLSSVCGGWGVCGRYRKAWEEALGDSTLIQSQHSLSGSFNEVRCRNSSGDYQE